MGGLCIGSRKGGVERAHNIGEKEYLEIIVELKSRPGDSDRRSKPVTVRSVLSPFGECRAVSWKHLGEESSRGGPLFGKAEIHL